MLRRDAGKDVRLPDRLLQFFRPHGLQIRPGQHPARAYAYFTADGQRRRRGIARDHQTANASFLGSPDRLRDLPSRRIPKLSESQKLQLFIAFTFPMAERQHSETFSGVTVGLLFPADALFDGKTAAL